MKTSPWDGRRGGHNGGNGGRRNTGNASARPAPSAQNETMDGPGPDVTIRDLIVYVAESVVNHPEDVHVTETEEAGVTIYQLHVAPDDMGKVIGRQGRVANALRAIVKVASARHDRRTMLEIV